MNDRVVFDCMIFLQAAGRATGPASACFDLIDDRELTLCLSPVVLLEVGEVLHRSELRKSFPLLSPERISVFLGEVHHKALMFTEIPKVHTLSRDPKDEKYVNLAVAAGARYLVTRDKDLLDLMNQDTPEGREFCRKYPNLRILDPTAFLREFESQS